MMDAVLMVLAGAALFGWAFSRAHAHRRGTPFAARAGCSLSIGAAVVLMAGGAQAWWPVTSDMRGAVTRIEPGLVEVMVVGSKDRDCDLIKERVKAYAVDVAGLQHKAVIEWPGDPAPGSSRAMGAQSFGLWLWIAPQAVDISRIGIQTYHSCGTWLPLVRGRFEVEVPR